MSNKINRIVELTIDIEDWDDDELFDDLGVNTVSLVDQPAIGVDFMYFSQQEFIDPRSGEDRDTFLDRCMGDSKMVSEYPDQDQRFAVCNSYYENFDYKFQSYNDYPEAARNNARRALEWAEENGWGSCGTGVGKARANQLAKGENISRDTIARMASFKRHEQHKDVPYSEGCGGLMWDAWGGSAGINWAISKLKEIEEMRDDYQFRLDDEQRIVTGPLMIPNKMIIRVDHAGDPYYVYFSKKTIRKMAEKFLKVNNQHNTDVMHNKMVVTTNTLVESWITESRLHDKSYSYGFRVPEGTWMVSYKINDDDTWDKIKRRELKGFSLDGPFIQRINENASNEALLSKIKDILNNVDQE